MSPETIFKICSAIAMIGWLALLLVSPFWLEIDKFLIGIVVALLCIVYAWLIVQAFSPGDMKNFGSLEGVMKLFESPVMVTAGWVHYLAFDLLVGSWIKRNSEKYGLPHLLMIPILLLTFMLGPIGLLVYLVVRWIRTGRYFSTNF